MRSRSRLTSSREPDEDSFGLSASDMRRGMLTDASAALRSTLNEGKCDLRESYSRALHLGRLPAFVHRSVINYLLSRTYLLRLRDLQSFA